jgi:hypothetical protein
MPTRRSRVDKVRDGHKAYRYRIAQFDPNEQIRAGEQAAWTRRYPGPDKADNPHLREKVYSLADLERAKRFAAWHTANLTWDHSENPHSWSNARRNVGAWRSDVIT